MNKCYVYVFYDKDWAPYYVGQGEGSRITKNRGRGCNKYCILSPPPERRVKLLENLSKEESVVWEEFLICFFGLESEGGLLLNSTYGRGGRGVSLLKGYKHSQETKERMSAAQKRVGNAPPLYTKPFRFISPEGEVMEGENLCELERNLGFPPRSLQRVKCGYRKSYKGWKLG